MNSREDNGEQADSVAAKLFRSNLRAWRWQRIGLIGVMTAAAILTLVLPRWLTKREPVKPVVGIEVEKATAKIDIQLTRVKLADALHRLRELEGLRDQMHQEVQMNFEGLKTNEVGRRIAADESAMLRYWILSERFEKLDPKSDAFSTTEIATALASPAISKHRLESAGKSAHDQRLKMIGDIREYQAIASVLAGLIEEAHVSQIQSSTLEEARGAYERKRVQMRSGTIERAIESVNKEAGDKLRAIEKQIEKYRAENVKLSQDVRI